MMKRKNCFFILTLLLSSSFESSTAFAGNEFEDLVMAKQAELQLGYRVFQDHSRLYKSTFAQPCIAQQLISKSEGIFVHHYMKPLINQYSWAIPNDLAIETLAKYSPIVEIGAGSGYWASLAAAQGADVVAYDHLPWEQYQGDPLAKRWFNVQPGNESKVLEHPGHTLFLCWPPLGRTYPLASKALSLFTGKYVIYVGEPKGGAQGDAAFFQLLDDEFLLVEEVRIPTWPGFSDTLKVYERVKFEESAAAFSDDVMNTD